MTIVDFFNSLEINEMNIISATVGMFCFSFALEFILTACYIIKSGVKSVV